MSEDEKPWKRDLVRTAANRRELVATQLETDIQAAPSFEEALRLAVDSLKKKFARYTAVSAYVADGEDLAMLTAANRPTGPERVGSGGPLADAARNPRSTMISNITEESAWKAVGLTVGSLLIAPVRTEAGLWAILEVWSDFRDSFTPQDQRLLERVATHSARRRPPLKVVYYRWV
jgi:GAF domain-containing protein